MLHHQVQNLALVVNGAPEKHPTPANRADHFIQMPTRRRRGAATLQVPGDLRAKLDRPAADRLVGDLDPALGEQFFDVSEAQGEPEVEPA